jgi:hypothetical protein
MTIKRINFLLFPSHKLGHQTLNFFMLVFLAASVSEGKFPKDFSEKRREKLADFSLVVYSTDYNAMNGQSVMIQNN